MRGPVWQAVTSFGAVLVFVAILVRLTSDKAPTTKTINAGFGAMTNIFQGVFRG